jgi:hypothetical protein
MRKYRFAYAVFPKVSVQTIERKATMRRQDQASAVNEMGELAFSWPNVMFAYMSPDFAPDLGVDGDLGRRASSLSLLALVECTCN